MVEQPRFSSFQRDIVKYVNLPEYDGRLSKRYCLIEKRAQLIGANTKDVVSKDDYIFNEVRRLSEYAINQLGEIYKRVLDKYTRFIKVREYSCKVQDIERRKASRNGESYKFTISGIVSNILIVNFNSDDIAIKFKKKSELRINEEGGVIVPTMVGYYCNLVGTACCIAAILNSMEDECMVFESAEEFMKRYIIKVDKVDIMSNKVNKFASDYTDGLYSANLEMLSINAYTTRRCIGNMIQVILKSKIYRGERYEYQE